MLPSRLDATDSTPLWQQVAAEIRRSITEGEIKSGERMPLARDLATVLGVNRNTVLRPLHELRDEGLSRCVRVEGSRSLGPLSVGQC